MTTATAASTTEQEWFAAVAARDEHDAQVRSYWNRTNCGRHAAAQVRREQGAKRAHLTRRIKAAEAAIDATR